MTMTRKRRIILAAVLVLFLCIFACQVRYYLESRLPAISGVVLDMNTGQPIIGADVGACYLGPMESLAAPARPIPIGGGGTTKTDAQGRFSFPAARLPLGSPLHLLFGPNEKSGIWLFVYSKDYVPCLSEAQGFDWSGEDRLILGWDWTAVHLERAGNLSKGFRYDIHLAQPESEREWRQKVQITGKASDSLPEKLAQEWLFNDLTGYLEKWPEGEKAAQFFDALLPTAMMGSCEYITEGYRKGELSENDLRIHLERQRVVLELSQRVDRSRVERLTKNSEDAAIRDIEPEMKCMQDLLNAKANGEGGRK